MPTPPIPPPSPGLEIVLTRWQGGEHGHERANDVPPPNDWGVAEIPPQATA